MKRIILLLIAYGLVEKGLPQSVGIGTASPNPAAQLDISSNSKGLLIPRMTQAERDGINAVQGLMIFNISTNSFQYHNGASWINITNSGLVTGTANKIPRFTGPWGMGNGMMTDNGAGISVNTNNAVADGSALLDMSSTSKGILVPRMTTAERTSIITPAKGLLVFDNTTSSFWFYNGTSWVELTTGNTSDWSVLGNNIYNNNSGNVGIGSSTPPAKLSVNGDAVISAGVGIATTTPDLLSYKLDVNGGIRTRQDFYANRDAWIDRNLDVDGTSNLFGNITAGSNITVANNVTVGDNVSVQSNLTVSNGKGIIRSSNSDQLKYYTREASFSAVLGPLGTSSEGAIGFSAGVFTSPPAVIVGDIVSTGGTLGQLYRVQLVIYDVTTTGCKCRLINTSNTSVDYSITWNIVCIGK